MKRNQGNPREVPVAGNHLLHSLVLMAIVCIQSFEITPDFFRFVNSPLWFARPLVWAVLFAILGQALVRSLAVHGWRGYLWHRLVRDWVPLACVILAVAVLVGPLVTDRTPRAYAMNPGLWTYFTNLVGFPQFWLPGVFELDNEIRTTVGLLWSVPVYLVLVIVVAVAGSGQGWRKLAVPLAGLAAIALALAADSLNFRFLSESGFSRVEAIGMPLNALLAGLIGVVWQPPHFARPRRRLLLGGMAALFAATGYWGNRDWVGSVFAVLGFALAGNVVLLTRGSRRRDWDLRIKPWMPVIYCTWLVSFPVQQLVVGFGPRGFGAWRNLVFSAPIALAIGVVMWRLLAGLLVRCGAEPIIGPARLPLGPMAVQRYSRRWWLARLRALVIIGAWSMALALIAAGLLALTLLAFQPDRVGV